MSREQIIQLLQIVTSYDSRKPSHAMVGSWLDAAQRGLWSYEDAVEAVREHFAHSTEYLMPGHITKKVAVMVRERGRYLEIEPRQPESESARRMREQVMREFHERRAARLNAK